jgi:DNA-binding transcriptional regulator YiaG
VTGFDYTNAPVVMGLVPATEAVIAEWEALGAPLPRRYPESSRESLRRWTPETNIDITRETYRLAVHFIQDAKMEEASRALRDAQDRRRAAREVRREQLIAELKETRAATGMTQAEVAALLSISVRIIENAEVRSSLSIERLEELLVGYQALAKRQRPPTIKTGPAGRPPKPKPAP